jgi:hypothetical protein
MKVLVEAQVEPGKENEFMHALRALAAGFSMPFNPGEPMRLPVIVSRMTFPGTEFDIGRGEWVKK